MLHEQYTGFHQFICTFKDVPSQPNIVLILADDFGYNDVGYHNPYVYTPNIDELARIGQNFNRIKSIEALTVR